MFLAPIAGLKLPTQSVSVVDPDMHGSAFILVRWIRIRIRNADPDQRGQNEPQK
jgi:hypothetical protein